MKRVISIILVFAMLLSPGAAASGAAADELISGTVRYCSGHDEINRDFETSFTYSDEFFSRSAYIYRQDLAAMSLAMALGAFSSKDGVVQVSEDQNWISIMDQCGFSEAVSNEWYRKQPVHDSIGVCCAKKAVTAGGEESTLIAVGIRGNFYRREWGGNMNVGSSGDHQGWLLCRDQVLDFVGEYIASENITGKVKLWMAGYSRAAATANLTAAALDDGYSLSDSVEISPDNIYCYCFETPLPTVNEDVRAEKYNNIQNFINGSDVVTCVPFVNWGFTRYGVDRVVPADGDGDYAELLPAMLGDFDTIPNNGGWYMIDDFRYIRYDPVAMQFSEDFSVSQQEYYALLGDALANDFAYSREDYAENLQFYLIEILGIIFNRYNLDFTGAMCTFINKLSDNYLDIMETAVSSRPDRELIIYMKLEKLLFESMNEAGITDFSATELYSAMVILMMRLTNMAMWDPEVTATLLANGKIIISAHYAELCMAWARTLPENYMTQKENAGADNPSEDEQPQSGDEQLESGSSAEESTLSIITSVLSSLKAAARSIIISLRKLHA